MNKRCSTNKRDWICANVCYIKQDHPDVGRSLASVDIGFEQLGRHEEALAYKKDALSLRQRLHEDKNHPDVAHSLNNVGETLIKLDQFKEGLGYCEQV